MDDDLYEGIDSCPVHGDEYIRECNICGQHFCTRCFPRSLVGEDCHEEEMHDDLDDDSEFSELSEYEDLLEGDDDEIDRLIEESDLLPPEDIDDDEEDDEIEEIDEDEDF